MAREKRAFIIPAGGIGGLVDDEAYRQEQINRESGFDPLGRGSRAPGPTRTTSENYCETNQRKPYQPVTDTSVPGVDEGISFRQKM